MINFELNYKEFDDLKEFFDKMHLLKTFFILIFYKEFFVFMKK